MYPPMQFCGESVFQGWKTTVKLFAKPERVTDWRCETLSSAETLCPKVQSVPVQLFTTMKPAALSGLSPRFASKRSRTGNRLHRATRVSPRIPEGLAKLDTLAGLFGAESGPNITFVYQDAETRDWAREAYQRLSHLASPEGVRATWWKISDLSAPGILAGAVSSAVRSDIIVIATRSEGLPLPFYVWVNLWWPHRPEEAGALVGLIGRSAQTAAEMGSVGEYLPIVAQQARMSYLKIEKSIRSVHKPERMPAFALLNHANGVAVTNGHKRPLEN